MPIVRVGAKLIYYAHVPKCAGTSVEDYLIERFGPLAFLDRGHHRNPAPARWSRTSPQHVDVQSLERLFPEDFFSHFFAVVRHPATRLRSSFAFGRKRNLIRKSMRFETWLSGLERRCRDNLFYLDNHVRPMDEIVPGQAQVFHLEMKMAGLVDWLDEIAGSTEGPRTIPKSNVDRPRSRIDPVWKGLLRPVMRPEIPALNEALCQKIHALYPQDYERFGYGIYDPLEKGGA